MTIKFNRFSYTLISLLLPFCVICQSTIITWASQKKVTVQPCKVINTPAREFSPAFYNHGIVYVTSGKRKTKVDKKIGEIFYELNYAAFSADGMPQLPATFLIEGDTEYYEGQLSFTQDGNTLYGTRSNKPDSKRTVRLMAYQASKQGNHWTNMKQLPFNNDKYSVCHPTISADGSKLYFSSDMPGGYGGMDLWFSERLGDNQWSSPINLGTAVNTEKNEVFPFLHPSGLLFFSSNGHHSVGGLDLFMINVEDFNSNTLLSLGVPFNSPKDDFGLILDADGSNGYFSSDRDGGVGKDDIYHFTIAEDPDAQEEKITAAFTITDALTKERIKGAAIYIFELGGNGMLNKNEAYDVEVVTSNNKEFNLKLTRKPKEKLGAPNRYSTSEGEAAYLLKKNAKYLFLIIKNGYEETEFVFPNGENVAQNPVPIGISLIRHTQTASKPPVIVPITSTLPKSDETAIINTPVKEGVIIVLDKIYYDFDKSDIRTDATKQLDALATLMKNHPQMEVELIAHTDTRGARDYNQRLSEQRAESAKKYLINANIAKNRIKIKGAGEEFPRNHCSDGRECSEEEHQYNRRTEVKILKAGE